MTKLKICALILFASILSAINCIKFKYVDSKDVPELEYLDKSVDPCDNFFKFACGNFHKVHPLPDGQYNIDHFTILQDEIHDLMLKILKSSRRKDEPVALQKAKAAYKACTSVNYDFPMSYLPQVRILSELGGWPLISHVSNVKFSWEHVGDLVANYGVQLFFDLQVGPNLFNASEVALWVGKDKLTNPATIIGKLDENLVDYLSPVNIKKRSNDYVPSPYEKFLRTMAYRLRDLEGTWKLNGSINEEIVELIDFMIDLSSAGNGFKPNVTLPSVTTIKYLQEWTDMYFPDVKLNWISYLNNVFKMSGVNVKENFKVLITSTGAIYGVLDLIRNTEKRILQNLIVTRLFTYMAPDGDYRMKEAFNEFYKAIHLAIYPRDQYCMRKILGYPDNTQFSFALAYQYQRYFYNINNLAKAAELVDDLQNSFDDMIRESDWIDDETKVKALKKSSNMITLLGFPEQSYDTILLDRYYENVRVCEWDHFGNSQRLRAMQQAIQFSQYGKPRNRELWNLSPLEVNAFYARENNRILFPLSIINPVFFNGEISVLDYGRIGAIIGHEITHGYDESGMTYDENGRFVGNWWSKSTSDEYKKRIGCFIEQYSSYYIEEIDSYVNATKTLNENLADNGGIKEAYKAFRKLTNRNKDVVGIKDYSLDQLFFIGYGTMWCMTETNYYLEKMHKNNVYSPGRYRVIGPLSNMKEFSDAFNCPIGSNMNPINKCTLW